MVCKLYLTKAIKKQMNWHVPCLQKGEQGGIAEDVSQGWVGAHTNLRSVSGCRALATTWYHSHISFS